MSGVYIKNMTLEEFSDYGDYCQTLIGTGQAEEIPDHGDLIDRSTMFDKVFDEGYITKVLTASKDELENALVNMPIVINNLPTVIPSDMEEL